MNRKNELTLNIFNPLFPWNEKHNEIFELSFHLPKKLLTNSKENTIHAVKKNKNKGNKNNSILVMTLLEC